MPKSEKKKKKSRKSSDVPPVDADDDSGESKSPRSNANDVAGAGDEKAKKKKRKKDKKKEKRHRRVVEEGKEVIDEENGINREESVNGEGTTTEATSNIKEERKKDTKKKKKDKKEKKKKRKKKEAENSDVDHDHDDDGVADSSSRKKRKRGDGGGGDGGDDDVAANDETKRSVVGGRVVASSATSYLSLSCPVKAKAVTDGTQDAENDVDIGGVTLLLFYQYVEPPWDKATFQRALKFVEQSGEKHGVTGRMRVASEGLNCTLTGTYRGVRNWCADLAAFSGDGRDPREFAETEFKLTDHLPRGQLFPKLHSFKVDELVNYGLAGAKAPPIGKTGVHLEPDEYHKKISETDTVIIDVRNHYEANIGQFVPPPAGATYVDPLMRKSTEFPAWLDKPETKEKLRGKQVLMYCTGGVRCERASALLRHKMETEEETRELGITGVYQLQGGVDKYFKEFPEGGWWQGKNYTFDKRFAHAPPAVEGKARAAKLAAGGGGAAEKEAASGDDGEPSVMGECEACHKPWDMYRGKRRCPTCGVPSLICRECFEADASKAKKLGRDVRCDLCVRENIRSKSQVRERDQRETEEYERRMEERQWTAKAEAAAENGGEYDESAAAGPPPADNPGGITRLFVKNMCARTMDEEKLLTYFPAVTHVLWIMDRKTDKWYGSAFLEMATAEDAARAVSMDGTKVLGRPITVKFEEADSKDEWPPRKCEVGYSEQSSW